MIDRAHGPNGPAAAAHEGGHNYQCKIKACQDPASSVWAPGGSVWAVPEFPTAANQRGPVHDRYGAASCVAEASSFQAISV